MKKAILLALGLYAMGLGAQTPVDYQYDAAGNRVARYRKSSVAPNGPAALAANSSSAIAARVGKIEADSIAKVETPRVGVFPNPSAGLFRIELNAPAPEARFELYDAAGRLIWSRGATFYSTTLDITREAAGEYLLFLRRAGEEARSWKLVKL